MLSWDIGLQSWAKTLDSLQEKFGERSLKRCGFQAVSRLGQISVVAKNRDLTNI